MAKILLDVNGWRSLHDFATGETATLPKGPLATVSALTQTHPYPGDLSADSLAWTTDAALALDAHYHPDFMFLSYATPYLFKMNTSMTPQEVQALDALALAQVQRFFDHTDFEPVVVCTGGMQPVKGIISLDAMEGYVSTSVHGIHYSGVFDATPADVQRMHQLPHITSILSKQELYAAFPDMCDYCYQELPDYIFTSEDGYSFNEFGSRGYTLHQLPYQRTAFGLHTTLTQPMAHILDIRPAIDAALNQGKKVALVVLEAIAGADYPGEVRPVDISLYKKLTYEQDSLFYAAILTGQPFYTGGMPTLVYNISHQDRNDTTYPLSHVTNKTLLPGIGLHPDKRTAAAGTRSMLTHCAAQCDIALECHSRSLTESGVCLFLNDKYLARL